MGNQARNFEPGHVPRALAIAVQASLDWYRADDGHSVKAIFQAARGIERYGLTEPYKLNVFERVSITGVVDPLGAQKDADEQLLTTLLLKWWSTISSLVIERLEGHVPDDRKAWALKQGMEDVLERLITAEWWQIQWETYARDELHELAQLAYERGGQYWLNWIAVQKELMSAGIIFNPLTVDTGAQNWAATWVGGIVAGFGATTRKGVGILLTRWAATENATTGDLRNALHDFLDINAGRAYTIGTTGVTRIYSDAATGSFQSFEQSVGGAAKIVEIFNTLNDDLVCPKCKALNGKEAIRPGVWEGEVSIPVHPRCRCFKTGKVYVI